MRILAVLLLLAACGNASDSQISVAKSVWERIKKIGDEPEAPGGKSTPTRAQIRALNVAMIQMNLVGEDIYPIMVPTHRNGAYVTYANKFRQSLTLRESQITATRGLGTDLISASSSGNDPLKQLTPPSRWPASIQREFRFAGGPSGQVESYTCTFSRGPAAQIVIAGTPKNVIGFAENCAGQDGEFQNLHAADVTTGRVWQSQQYVGSRMAPIALDILEPLTQ